MSANKIQLTKNEESVLFTFTDSNHYLTGNGTIEVPINSLSLVIDKSNMVTFRKAASNDIFVSAPISDFGMTKAELEEWYAENMVGGTGGGGIDPETLAELVSSAEYVSSSSTIDFKNVDGDVISTINAEPFITDGMVDNVQISGSNLVITFNVDAGKQPISIPLTDIFNPSNYYDKSATDALLDDKQDTLQYYSEDTENIQAIIGTGTDDGEGTLKSSEITSSVNNGIPYTDLFTQTSVNDGDDNYVKNTDIYADPEEGVQLIYHTEDYIEDTSFNTQLNINADGVKIKVNDFDIFTASANESGIEVPSEGGVMNGIWLNANEIDMYAADTEILINDAVTINGEEVVTESWLEDYATVQDLEDTEEVLAQSINVLADKVDGIEDSEEVIAQSINVLSDSLSGKQDTLVSGTNIKTINNTSLLGSGNIDIQGGGGSSISSCTQAQYDAAEQGGTLDSDTMYVISDAPAVNIANYYTKTEVDDLLLNVDIDVDTAITAGGTNAVEGGAIYTALQGKVNNGDAVVRMQTGSTANGTVLQYSKDGSTYTTATSIGSINGTKIATDTAFQLVTQSDYDEAQRVTAAALNDLNDRFGGMRIEKLTQAQYDALVTKDDNTLYIITNVVNNA